MKISDNVFYVEEADMWWAKNAGPFQHKNENEDFLNVIDPFLKGHKVAIQAGGHCGYMARQFRKKFHMVYTFEPLSSSFYCLCLNNPDENIIKNQACLGHKHELMYIEEWAENNSGASCVNDGTIHLYEHGYGTPFTIIPKKQGKIPMYMIDDLALEQCDFIQLDLEGYEYNALIGGTQTITKFKPLLCLERVWSCRYGIDENVTDTLLKQWGYVEVASINTDHIYQFKG